MSRTYKDVPYQFRKHKKKKRHPHMMRDNKMSECNYGPKCCGWNHEHFVARTIEKRQWRKELVSW